MVASMAMTAMSASQASSDAKAKGAYDRDVGQYNARLAENEATEVRNKGTEEENIQRRKVAELQSKQRAKLGAAGVDLDSGSAFQLLEDTEIQGEADALRIRSNFNDEANSLDQQAMLTGLQGEAANSAGINRANAITTNAAGSLLSQGATVSSKWNKPNSANNQFGNSGWEGTYGI